MSFRNWNENNSNHLSSNNWRASLVPAAAVIPAPIAYIKVAAVDKLVVGHRSLCLWSAPLGFVLRLRTFFFARVCVGGSSLGCRLLPRPSTLCRHGKKGSGSLL